MDAERKLIASEATTVFFVLLGEKGSKSVLDWMMKEGLIPYSWTRRRLNEIKLAVDASKKLLVKLNTPQALKIISSLDSINL
ncbi:hypothetical protein TNCT_88501 [Trichonephila clavata]|uniref:Uncharacterized protein n=1 Tax=Trichonephila clavata TaxID=2740835 RepID=A0A8X6F1P9_TRICU|nr:hypothetical protein TNCT_88501 [Trichonephila clavata]